MASRRSSPPPPPEPCLLKVRRADVHAGLIKEIDSAMALKRLTSDVIEREHRSWEDRVKRLLGTVWFTGDDEAHRFQTRTLGYCLNERGGIDERIQFQAGLLAGLRDRLDTYEEASGVGDAPPSSMISCDLSSLHPKIVQRCKVPFETALYDEAVLNAFKLVEEEIRQKVEAPPQVVGVDLVSKAMSPNTTHSPRLVMSMIPAEQQAAHDLYRGAIGFLKNPQSHRFLDTTDPVRAFEVLAFASFLMRKLDEAAIVG